VRVALAQVDCCLGDLDANLARTREVTADAAGSGVDLVVFPELNLTGYSLGAISHDVSLPASDPRLAALAPDEPAVVVGFAEQGRVDAYNSAVHVQGGEVRHVHRKLYLPTYGIHEERKHFSPGQALRAYDDAAGRRLALLVCNDAWQPVLPFLAVQDGAAALLVPTNSAVSAYPDVLDTRAYWRSITRFYGQMYQTFVVFVNRVGAEGELVFWGGSHVVDPEGRVVAEAPEGEEALLVVDLDLAAVRRRRRLVPLVREARLGLLQRELARLLDEGGDS